MKFGSSFQLSRYVVVVPVYSDLVIQLKLMDYDNATNLNSESFSFMASDQGCDFETKGSIKVRIDWVHPYKQRLPGRNLKHDLETSSSREKEDSKKSRALSSYRSVMSKKEASVMEIFSVFVGDWVSEIYGEITADDRRFKPRVVLYKRDERSREVLSKDRSDNEVAHIEIGNTCRILRGEDILVNMRLKDEEGRGICVGSLGWLDRSLAPYWFEKRQCYVVVGKHGYAAMHYMVFPTGLPATVSAWFCPRESHPDAEFSFYGKIVSEYGNYKCKTDYEKEYYRSRLLVRPQSNPLVARGGGCEFNIPLLKTQVAMPENCPLTIHAELRVGLPGGGFENFEGSVDFEANVDKEDSKNLEGKQFYIRLSVKWGNVYGNHRPPW